MLSGFLFAKNLETNGTRCAILIMSLKSDAQVHCAPFESLCALAQ